MSQPGEDYYNDGGDESPAAAATKPKGEDGDAPKTSILPRSFFAGKDLKVGDKCDVTVAAIHENDVEVEPCGSGDEEEEKPEEDDQPPDEEGSQPPDAAAQPDGDSMASMMG